MPAQAGPQQDDLASLIAKQQITELIYRYCRAVDRIDLELAYSVWHEGAEADYGSIYQGTGRGVVEHICAAHEHGVVHSHQITNILIDLDGDHANSEAYITSGMIMLSDGQPLQVTTRGRYLDRWSRRDGRWGIDKRYFCGDINEIRPLTFASVAPRFTLDRNDPSYALFEGRL